MSPFEYRPATRSDVPLLLGLVGGTGGGKTYSAMRLAHGLAGEQRFAVLDTENGRASHYADQFAFDVADLRPPYRPEHYTEAIAAADKAGYPVIVVDSMSHEWGGDGGLLDWHEEEHQRMGGRDNTKLSAWIKPKMAHRKFVTQLLQVKAHLILCFRAAERVEMVKGEKGRMEVVPKRTRTGLDGWVLITEKELPFELTVSLLMTEDQPGFPKPIKLPQTLAPLVPLDQPISEQTGELLGEWAAGKGSDEDKAVATVVADLLDAADLLGVRDRTMDAIGKNRRANRNDLAKHGVWLQAQLEKAKAALDVRADTSSDDIPVEPQEKAA